MNFLRLGSLKTRLILLSILGIIPIILSLYFYVLPLFENYLLEERRAVVKNAVDLTIGALNEIEADAASGKISEEQAKERGRDIVRHLKYNETDYMFAYSYKGVVEAHGLKREMEGKDASEAVDPKGKPYVKEILQYANTTGSGGSGFVSYLFEKQKGSQPVSKISYIKVFPNWKWLIGTGVYLDTIETTMASLKLKIAIGFGIIVCIAFFLALFFAGSLTKNLAEISDGLAAETAALTEAANTLAEASGSLSASSSQQAAALQETTASLEETSAMIAKNADNAKLSQELSQNSQSNVGRGKEAVEGMTQSIHAIAQSNENIAKQIQKSNQDFSDIVNVIDEISNKTKVINDIVFQTKLLSFNASVEAARAGENGKGFAVVAEEVGNLAQMSGNSAKEISELLEASTKRVRETIESSKKQIEILIGEGHEKIQSGLEKSVTCTINLDEIVSGVEQVSARVSEIATATLEQSRGINEINKAMVQLDAASQQTNVSSQQSADTAELLREQIKKLNQMTQSLSKTIYGHPFSNKRTV